MKIPWAWLIIIGLAVVITIFVLLSYGSGYKMVREWLSHDQTQIESQLKSQLATIAKERDAARKQLTQLQASHSQLQVELKSWKDAYATLEAQKQNIQIPNNPSDLADAFRKHGFSPRLYVFPD